MIDILADECVDFQLVFALRRLGYEVRTVREFSGSKYGDGISDAAVLQLAREHRLAVLTTNISDYVALHPNCPWHHGILLVEVEENIRAQARRIDQVLRRIEHTRGLLIWLTVTATKPRQPRRRKRRGG